MMADQKLLLFALLATTVLSSGNATIEKKQHHPGCLIWWFLPDCPLGIMFGGDPFGIYPWAKFCKRYTAFDEFCQSNTDVMKRVRETNENGVGVHSISIIRQPRNQKSETYGALVLKMNRRCYCISSYRLTRQKRQISKFRLDNRINLMDRCKYDFDFNRSYANICGATFNMMSKRRRRRVAQPSQPDHPGCKYFWFLPR
jgi:hypothetical protein